MKKYLVLSELEYRDLSLKYGEVFEASIGAGAVRKLYEEVDLDEIDARGIILLCPPSAGVSSEKPLIGMKKYGNRNNSTGRY